MSWGTMLTTWRVAIHREPRSQPVSEETTVAFSCFALCRWSWHILSLSRMGWKFPNVNRRCLNNNFISGISHPLSGNDCYTWLLKPWRSRKFLSFPSYKMVGPSTINCKRLPDGIEYHWIPMEMLMCSVLSCAPHHPSHHKRHQPWRMSWRRPCDVTIGL